MKSTNIFGYNHLIELSMHLTLFSLLLLLVDTSALANISTRKKGKKGTEMLIFYFL